MFAEWQDECHNNHRRILVHKVHQYFKSLLKKKSYVSSKIYNQVEKSQKNMTSTVKFSLTSVYQMFSQMSFSVFSIMLSVKHCCEMSKLYILFIDKEHTVLGISVKTTWKFCEAKFQFFSQYNNCFTSLKEESQISL